MTRDGSHAVEPLMREDGANTDELSGAGDEHEPLRREGSPVSAKGSVTEAALGGDARPGSFVWLLTLAAGVSGLLFGYDTGVISSTLVSIHKDLSDRRLTTFDKSIITSATALFALLASPCTGFLADTIGRKRVILLASFLFVVGALWQAAATTVAGMVVGRSIVGAAVGSASFVVPLYISELSPSAWRGRLVTVAALFVTGGQVVAYLVGWMFSAAPAGWRWMVGLGALPAAVQLAVLVAMPETPRYLAKAGMLGRAEAVLGRVYGTGEGKSRLVASVLGAIQGEIAQEEAETRRKADDGASRLPIVDLLSVGGHRRALVIACMLQGAQQLCGFNSLMYFSATIFSLVGFASPTLTSLVIAVTNFLFTIIAFFSIDRVGRRRILLYSIPFMVAGLALAAIAFLFIDVDFTIQAGRPKSGSPHAPTPWAALLLVVSFATYVSMYALGLGNVPWQQSELFPLRVRSIGASIATATNWLSNTVVGLSFLPMLEIFSPQVTFLCYAAVCCGAWCGVWLCYPETAGLGLEDVGKLLEKGWGVKESMLGWEQRRRIVMRGNYSGG